jgi:GrpB-like predicted nucleotidyltransferase (UPF0157 family)
MDSLVWSDTLLDEADRLWRRVAGELTAARVPGDVVLVGPASLPGVLTRGDIDLHLRVPAGDFAAAVERLHTCYRPTSRDSWAPTLAVFDIPATRPAGLAVTPVGSEHDRRFTTSWRRLRSEPDLLREYNALKSAHVATPDYEERKSAFFSRISAP